MFLPYKADVSLVRFPFFTILVCVICICVYVAQIKSERAYAEKLSQFCTRDLDHFSQQLITEAAGTSGVSACANLFIGLHEAKDPKVEIEKIVSKLKPQKVFQDIVSEKLYMRAKFEENLALFERDIPTSLTDELAYNPAEYKVWRMFTSVFTHADFMHIFGNLLFFYMFAATLEVIIGSAMFVGVFFALAMITSVSYSLKVSGGLDAPPTIGLSGVVFGVMTFTSVLVPNLKIKCVFWFIIFWRVFRINAIFIAAWYLLWNIYDLMQNSDSQVNYIAHVSGALVGILFGIFYRIKEPKRLREVIGF